MPEINLFLDSRLNRIGKKRVYRLDVVNAINAKLEEAEIDSDYFDAWFRASELAESGDNLEDYLSKKGAIDCEEIRFALQLIDASLKQYLDALEGALRAEPIHA